MSNVTRNRISALLLECSQFTTNDVLVNAHDAHSKLYFSDISAPFLVDEFPRAILKEADAVRKESGVNSLCLGIGRVELTINDSQVLAPVFLSPLHTSIDKVNGVYRFEEESDARFVNPFLIFHLQHELSIDLPQEILADEGNEIFTFLEEKSLHVEKEIRIIGNFHHHRYQVIKELEGILDSDAIHPSIETLFGAENIHDETIDLSGSTLFPADTDHERVFKQVETSNTVVQGPPGTGKSQVISNLIGKAVHHGHTLLAVSEKRSALDVIASKLAEFELNRVCFIAGSHRLEHSFLLDLKETWDYFEAFKPVKAVNLRLSEQYEDHLQMTLDMLSQEKLIGGVSFHDFQEHAKRIKLTSNYSSEVPEIDFLLDHFETIQAIYAQQLAPSLSRIRMTTLHSDDFLQFDLRIAEWQDEWARLNAVFGIENWSDLSEAIKKAALCQVYENDLFKKYSAIFTPESKEQKQFLRLRKQFNQMDPPEQLSEWKILPSLQEANSLKTELVEGSFLSKRKAIKRWKQLSHLPISNADASLQRRISRLQQEQKHADVRAKMIDLGLDDPESEVSLIWQTLSTFTADRWKEYLAIPKDHRNQMTSHHDALDRLHRALLHAFHFDTAVNVYDFFAQLKLDLSQLIALRPQLVLLNSNALQTLKHASSTEEYQSLVFSSHFSKFKARFPAFSEFNPTDILAKVEDVIRAQTVESKLEAQFILEHVHERFSQCHALLNTPASKLNEEQKALKKRLRTGKSILVKEFGKTRSHPSLRELFHSEAREWIQLLKPVWLSNPVELAKCFPMDRDLFDLVIFDEASQIPIQNALGAVQRSKKIVVAGDEHQMGPTSYFKRASSEPIDLLHQASYHFPKVALSHHYRSAHPDLIAFSNRHFYQNQLKAYPSYAGDSTVIRHHYVSEGTFLDRANLEEAKQIAGSIAAQLHLNESLGIVAFSEEQLSCIWNALGGKTQSALLDHIETNGGFFKALENVQGDECDRLIIGFGYAKNEEGEFHLRFGPMNTSNGRRRLNVLLTRARLSIDFFCSVQSSDFKISENESINLLRQWIAYSENYSADSEVVFAYGLSTRVHGNELEIHRIQESLPTAREVVTLQRVLNARGWKIVYC